MNASELRQESVEQLKNTLITLREAQFKLRMQKATSQLTQTHLLKENKHDIARVKMVLGEKSGEQA